MARTFNVRIFSLLALFLSAVFNIAGQGLTGRVVDSRGDAVVGAEVVLERAGVLERTVTAGNGGFSIASSTGKLSVSASGFETVTMEIGQARSEPITITLAPAGVVGNVNVTVTRSDMLMSENAASIAVITIASLNVTAARTVDDTIRQVAGLQLFRRSSSRTTNPTAQGANLRGVSGSGASRASVLFDALSVNDTFGGWTYWSRVPLIAVEQIEVFRGGASSFHGSGALSGAINIVPIDLYDDEKVRLRFESSIASQSTADASGVVLTTWKNWEADLTGDLFRTAGYVPVEENSRGRVDTPASSRHSNIILKIARRFGERDRAFVRGSLFGERRDNGTSLTNNQTNFRELAAGIDAGDLIIRVYGQRQVYDQTFSSVSADRNIESLTRLQRVPSGSYGTTVLWSRKFGDHSLAAAFDLMNARGFSDEIGYSADSPTSVGRSGGEARDLSLFVHDGWDAARRLTLSLSARLDQRRNSGGLTRTQVLSSGAVTETRFPPRDEPAFSPRIGAVYEVNENLSVYGAHSRSFRAPSLNELYRGFRVGNIVTNANAFLTPERSETFEAGGSAVFFGRRLISRASVYSTRVTDPVVSITLSSTPALITRERRNVGSTTSRGLEFELESRPVNGVNLNLSYLLVDAKISDFPASPELVGNLLPQVPRHSFTAQFHYRIGNRWAISTQLRAASSQFEDDRNSLPLRKLFTADARASYKFPYFIEAFASVENVFDARYDIALTPVRSVAAPRSIRLGLRIDFSKR